MLINDVMVNMFVPEYTCVDWDPITKNGSPSMNFPYHVLAAARHVHTVTGCT